MTRQCLIILAQIKFYCALFAAPSGARLLMCVRDVKCLAFIYLVFIVRGLKSSCRAHRLHVRIWLSVGSYLKISTAVGSYENRKIRGRGDMHIFPYRDTWGVNWRTKTLNCVSVFCASGTIAKFGKKINYIFLRHVVTFCTVNLLHKRLCIKKRYIQMSSGRAFYDSILGSTHSLQKCPSTSTL